jgi:hypothetical protein
MKDFLGNELKVGDFCVLIEPSYRNLIIGKVTKITAKRVKLVLPKKSNFETTIHPRDCVIISDEDALRRLIET